MTINKISHLLFLSILFTLILAYNTQSKDTNYQVKAWNLPHDAETSSQFLTEVTAPSASQRSSMMPASAPPQISSSDCSVSDEKYVLTEALPEIGFSQSLECVGVDGDCKEPIFSITSRYQEIEIYETRGFGRVLVLDEVTQITERDGANYNEMMAALPIMQYVANHYAIHGTIENLKIRVLLIGGGDGYVLSEILKFDFVEHVDHVDLDGDVVEACRKYFKWGNAWDDARSKLHIADGAKFVRDSIENGQEGFYDVIIQDSSDPFSLSFNPDTEKYEKTILPSSILYSDQHFRSIERLLSDNGIFLFQAETYNLPSDLEAIQEWVSLLSQMYNKSVLYGTIAIPTYPTGQIGAIMCEKNNTKISSTHRNVLSQDQMTVLSSVYDKINSNEPKQQYQYYHPLQQTAAFDSLPAWVVRTIYG